jgi:hypothetical protein
MDSEELSVEEELEIVFGILNDYCKRFGVDAAPAPPESDDLDQENDKENEANGVSGKDA